MLKLILHTIIFIVSGLLFSSCNQAPSPEQEAPKGVLRIVTVPADMPITINGKPKGNSASGPGQYFQILLEEGEHKIEVLKPVNKEKDIYGEKTIFIAGDTVQTITVEAAERLTDWGQKEKVRREAEVVERKRIADIERKQKQDRLTAANKPHIETLNNTIIQSKTRYPSTFSFEAKNCSLKVINSDYKNSAYVIDLGKLNIQKFLEPNPDGYSPEETVVEKLVSYNFICKSNQGCIYETDDPNFLLTGGGWFSTTVQEANDLKPVVYAISSIAKNCQ